MITVTLEYNDWSYHLLAGILKENAGVSWNQMLYLSQTVFNSYIFFLYKILLNPYWEQFVIVIGKKHFYSLIYKEILSFINIWYK